MDEQHLHKFSHDLRNILSIIYADAELLGLSLREKGMEEENAMARSLLESAQKIEKLLMKELGGSHGE